MIWNSPYSISNFDILDKAYGNLDHRFLEYLHIFKLRPYAIHHRQETNRNMQTYRGNMGGEVMHDQMMPDGPILLSAKLLSAFV